MARFLPAQIRSWTQGELIMTASNREDSEHFYRGISTDTRSIRKGELFVALKGENFDGHDFVFKAMDKGAAALLIEEDSAVAKDLSARHAAGEDLPDLILVKDCLEAYGNLACGYRKTLLASVIAITGSVGKTTTRRMVSEVIADQVCTHETLSNQNNAVGVPLTLLNADDDDDVIVAELGMDRVGEIKTLSDISKPDIAILTSIAYSHAKYLGSLENILREKTQITHGMKSNGLVIINGQDKLLREWAKTEKEKISIWSVSAEKPQPDERDNSAHFWAEDVQLSGDKTSFIAKTDMDESIALRVTVPAPGRYLVRTALFALASAYALGLDMEKAAKSCAHFKNTGQRQKIVAYRDFTVIDDSYNASRESIVTALETMQLIAKPLQRKIACLGGIRELGEYTEKVHRSLAEAIRDYGVDALYLVGEEMKYLQAALAESASIGKVKLYKSSADLSHELLEELQSGDLVLLKGSRYYEMEKIHEALVKNAASSQDRGR